MDMVRYGTQLLIVDNDDKIWQIYGMDQDVGICLLIVWLHGQMLTAIYGNERNAVCGVCQISTGDA
jgi:hypothetical protein